MNSLGLGLGGIFYQKNSQNRGICWPRAEATIIDPQQKKKTRKNTGNKASKKKPVKSF